MAKLHSIQLLSIFHATGTPQDNPGWLAALTKDAAGANHPGRCIPSIYPLLLHQSVVWYSPKIWWKI